ncbi:AAA family ATPase [Fusarium pseudocircinatum]|uniref:AAA family ATPase n=1 Tax=Fusarium pseudocircinatum TaxID=56676 RepID=A0A8H5L8L7_9HYPO|nr:AAA family ATPase [Fusarium pseudocircinatum]
MASRLRRSRELESPRVVIQERRKESSHSNADGRQRRRISPASSDEDITRRKVHDDAGTQDSDPEYHPQPEPEDDTDRRHRPMVPFSWRNEMCRFLNVSPDALDEEVFQAMRKAAKTLKEAEQMRARYEARRGPPRYEIIHSVRCEQSRIEDRLYLDQPWVVESGPNNAHLRGSQPILNFELFLERNKEVVFIVYKDYRCCGRQRDARTRTHVEPGGQVEASSLLTAEHISIISPDLSSAMERFSETTLADFPHTDFKEGEEMKYPYMWWFHRRKEIDEALNQHEDTSWSPMVNLVRGFVLERMEEEWQTVDGLLARKKISLKYMDYLFVPNQIALSTEQGRDVSKLQGVKIGGWLERQPFPDDSAILDVTFWTFDGTFHKASKKILINDLPIKVRGEMEEFNITELPLYPIEYASNETTKALRSRGRMFWKCRFRNYVGLSQETNDEVQDSNGSRFMVDITTHKKLHRDSNVRALPQPSPGLNDLESKYMSQENPDLGDNFFMCLPTSVFGFNMDKKEWVNLDVHFLRDVVWNTEAFDHLVVPEETKLLIQAVVTNQLQTIENADLIRGKGNGLFILLHGGPGTGKTLTAESVAEVARKPLYRVTCGDIGTKAEEVEQYLNVVLHLGKTWGCVVLLDEADVFLEQRSLVNLERNALVSVFLRVLEYYDGILILTSNRVGIFDEAFKSRIQLNLRYKNLDQDQRLQIWKNFFNRLRRLEEEASAKHSSLSYGAKVDEMLDKLDELAQVNLNGRQIRNAVSTARQLARYQKEPLSYKHLTVVINEAKKFDDYLLELNKTFTADEIQRDKGER